MRVSRRRFLTGAAAAVSGTAGLLPSIAAAQMGAAASVSQVEVNARPIASFDPRDATHVRFGSLEFRSGLVLTSSFKGFGGLSA